MALVHGAGQIVVRGLVLYLDAASPRSYPGTGSTWTDRSGNGIDGTLTNGPTYSSTNGGSLVFDGLDDYATTSCSQFQSGNNPFTIELWFRWFGDGTNIADLLFSYGEDVVGGNRLPLVVISDTNKIQFEFGSLAGLVYSSTTIQTNTWYQTVCTYDLSSTKVYINGSLENTTSYSSANVSLNGYNGQKAAIGCLFSSFGTVGVSEGFTRRYATYNGNISVVKYYNRALTATEVTQNYNALKSRYINLPVPAVVTSGLQMYLDAGNLASYNPSTSGLTWTDLSGNGNNGTLSPTSIGYSSANGGSLVFDGTDDLISTTFATTSGQAVTYAGWVYDTQTVDGTYKNFVDSISVKPMIWWNSSGKIEFDTTSGGFTTTPIYRAKWVYVTLSKPSGSSSPSYYVNGFLLGTGSAYSTPAVTPTWLNRGGSNTWKGNCSIIQAYNIALTAAEVRQNFDATRSRYGI